MASKKRKEVTAPEITGLKLFDPLRKLLARLHDEGCARDSAGNRTLHYDEYCSLVLLYLFNPILTSLRGIQQASQLSNVQKKLGCSRASLGSLSEAATLFDAERLPEIITELVGQVRPLERDPRLKDVRHLLTLCDGSLLKVLPQMSQAMLLKSQTGSGLVKWRLHTQFEIERHVPLRIDVTEGSGRGTTDERDVLERHLQPDRCYVIDRGYAKFGLFNAIEAAGSSYVCRIRDNSHWEVKESLALTPDDEAAGIVSDQKVQLGNTSSTNSARLDHLTRVIVVQIKAHPKRGKTGGGSAGHPSDGWLRIATNLLDVPAHVIALIYRYRWTIEIFFRFLKHVLGCRHLLSHDENGIKIQTYCAIIACLLISLWTGRKPNLRTYEMICFYFSGLATEQDLLDHISRLPPHPTKKA